MAELPAEVNDQVLQRIRNEYLEMPGLCLTLAQARRLWGLDDRQCRRAMQHLVDAGLLCRALTGPGDPSPDPAPGSIVIYRLSPPGLPHDPPEATLLAACRLAVVFDRAASSR